MHPAGCCPTTGFPTTADSVQMAHILGEPERREVDAEGDVVVVGGQGETAESSSHDSVRRGRPWAADGEARLVLGLLSLSRHFQTSPSLHSRAAGLACPNTVPSSPNLSAHVLLGHNNTPAPRLALSRTAAAKALHPPARYG